VVNPTAKESLKVMTALFQSGLTSAARNWFQLRFEDPNVQAIDPLANWLYGSQRKLIQLLQSSNFYSSIQSFYTEYGGFGTSAIGIFPDTKYIFRFEPLTAGEYVFSTNAGGLPDTFIRRLFMTPKRMAQKFGKRKLPIEIKRMLEEERSEAIYLPVLHAVFEKRYLDKPFTSVYFLEGNTSPHNRSWPQAGPLMVSGFYEFPYIVSRFDVVGADEYGSGPGHDALPNVKRLQEMEKSFLLATHKAVDPPVNVPSKMRGKTDLLPGGINYFSDPQQKIEQAYNVQLDFQGVSVAVERVESRIKRTFYNDLFLTSSRDPNASPLRTGQVEEQSEERMIQLGPVVQRLQTEAFEPLIERCFNMALRANQFEALPPDLAAMAGNYEILMVSPLAQAQKQLEARSIQSYVGFIGAIAQYDPKVLDKVSIDRVADEYADIAGVPTTILATDQEVEQIRTARARAQQAQMQREQQLIQNQQQMEAQKTQSEVAKNFAQARESTGGALGPQ
jgi:hypothetical protein